MRKVWGARPLEAMGLAALLVSLVAGQGLAATQLPEDATLDDFLAYAAENSPALKAAVSQWEAAASVGAQARSLRDPVLSLSIAQMEQRTTVGLSQMLPLFGKRALEGEVADELAAAAERGVDAVLFSVYSRVVVAYSDYVFAHRTLENLEENLALLRQLEQVMLARYRADDAPFADLVRAQVERGRLEDEVRSWQDRLQADGASLNAAIGRTADSTLPELGPLQAQAVTLDGDEVLAGVRESNPDLASIRHKVAAAELGIDLSRKAYYPDLGLGLELMRSSEMNRNGVGAMVSVNLPIWRGRLRAGVQEAEARHDAVQAQEEEAANLLEARARGALFRFNDALRKAALYQDELIPQARLSQEATEAAYSAGSATYQDLIESYRTVLSFELVFARALTDQVRYLGELEMYMGRRLRP